MTSGSSNTLVVTLCDLQSTTLIWNTGSYDSEVSFVVYDPNDEVVYNASSVSAGTLTTFTTNCTPPTCPKPVSVSVSSISDNSADVSWIPGGNETAWNLEYKANTEATWTVVPVTTTSYTLTNLSPSTNYNVRVQADCGGGDVSDYRETSFVTACGVISTFPYDEGFENGGLGCWVNESVVGDNPWTYYSYSGNTGTASVHMSYTDNTMSRLVSPIFDLTGLTSPKVSFYYSIGDYLGTADTFAVYYRTAASDSWVRISGYNQSTSGYMMDSLDLPTPSATYQISFVASNSYGHGVALDDVQVYDDDGAGPWIPTTPTVVTDPATNVTQTTATMNGTVTNPDNVSVTPMGFEWKESSAIAYTVVTVTGSALTHSLSNLTAGTQYTYKAFITYNGMTYYGNEVTFTTTAQGQPTEPSATTLPATAISENSATLNATITNPDNVSITAKGFEWKATTGGTYTQISGTGTGNTFTANLSGLTANTNYTYKAFITFNGTTVYGNEMTFTTLPEDTPEPCDAPTDLQQQIALKDEGGIYVCWTDNANVSQWNLQYRLQNNGEWTTVVVTGSPCYSINGLINNEDYEVRVQAVCAEDNLSDWSEILIATATNSSIDSYLLNSIVLYPNPANDVVNVECTMNNVQMEGIEVIDVYGKVVRTVVGTNNYSPIRINVSGLANGMYFVRVTTDAGTVTKSFVKK